MSPNRYPIPRATLISSESFLTPNTKITDRYFRVPLSYSPTATDETLTLFTRTVTPTNNGKKVGDENSKLPYFLYLQGGPGFECSSTSPSPHPVTAFLFEKGYQVLYLDQRGTGMSTPISADSLGRRGSVDAQVEYLKLFRADNIVRDSEAVRKAVLGDEARWSVLGQSFGGFCAVAYLSICPEGLKEVFTTGGMPPMVTNPDKVYRRLYEKLAQRNAAYYAKYPQDVGRVRRILRHLDENPTQVPNGGDLTPNRFLSLGIGFGMHGGADSIHLLVQRTFSDIEQLGEISYKALQTIQGNQSFDGNIMYALCHEMIYCQGEASNWSAQRTLTDSRFNWITMSTADPSLPVYFTGEMIYPHTFTDHAQLSKVDSLAHALASDPDWPDLYDLDALANNTVPVYAATYMQDMYVDYDFARDTAARIAGAKEFVTNVLYHSALRAKTDVVMGELWKLKVGEEDCYS